MVNKLSLAQLNLVFSANIRRWHKAQNNIVEHHNLALEKVLLQYNQEKGDSVVFFNC